MYTVVYTCRRPSTWFVKAVYKPCTRPYSWVHGQYRAVYTCTQSAYTAVYTTRGRVHGCVHGPFTRPCADRVYVTRPCRSPVHGLCTYTAVYTIRVRTHGRVHGRSDVYAARTRPRTPVHCLVTGRVHLYTTRTLPCTWPCSRAHGRIHVSTARTRPWTRPVYTAVCITLYRYLGHGRMYTDREHGPYMKPIAFASFSQTLVSRSVNKAMHHIAYHRKFIKYGVKQDLG